MIRALDQQVIIWSIIMNIAGINPIVAIIIGLLLIGLVFRFIKGVIRLVVMLGIFAVLAYIVLNYAR
jgi:hypothetical protein